MSLTLRGCPFCGSGNQVVVIGKRSQFGLTDRAVPFGAAVECSDCGARGPSVGSLTRTETSRKARSAWDERTV